MTNVPKIKEKNGAEVRISWRASHEPAGLIRGGDVDYMFSDLDFTEKACMSSMVLFSDYEDPISFYCSRTWGHEGKHNTSEEENGFRYTMEWESAVDD